MLPLKLAGCENVITKNILGAPAKQSKLDKILRSDDSGDVLTVWLLDRVEWSLQHLLNVVGDLRAQSVGLQLHDETIDTTTANGELIFYLRALIAQFERFLIIERTQAGRVATKTRGVCLGPPLVLTFVQMKHARKHSEAGERPSTVVESMGLNHATP